MTDHLAAAHVPTKDHQQGMIALVPEDRELDRLALEGGEPREELHLTLLFLGDAEAVPDDVYRSLQHELASRAEDLTLLEGDAFAVSHFNPHSEDPCVCLQVGGVWLHDAWEEAFQAVRNSIEFEQSSWRPPEQHVPWVPHVTLAYGPTLEHFAEATKRVGPVVFDRLRLALGDEVTDFDLNNEVVVASAGEVTSEAVLERRTRRFEETVSRALRRAVRAGTRSLGEVLTASGWQHLQESAEAVAAVSLDDLSAIEEAWRVELATTIDPAIARVYEEGARDSRALLQELVNEVPIAPVTQRAYVAEAYLSEANNRLRGIGTDLWRRTRLQLNEGLAAGEGIDELSSRVRGVLASTDTRARVIARTEVVAASNAGSLTQMRAAGAAAPVKKTWLATKDSRTRLTHRAADGQTVFLDESFNVGASRLDYPGDPSGSAAEVIQCRCVLLYDLADEFSGGQVI